MVTYTSTQQLIDGPVDREKPKVMRALGHVKPIMRSDLQIFSHVISGHVEISGNVKIPSHAKILGHAGHV